MKFLECPYCKKQAVKGWELLVFPSRFWLYKLCRHCNNVIRFDFNTIWLIICSMIIGIVLGNVIIRLFSINSTIFEAICLISFMSMPAFFGRKLFLKGRVESGRREKKEDRKREE